MLKNLFLLFLLLINISPVLAGDLPKGVKPEQGKAWNLAPVPDSFTGEIIGDTYTELSFWNVGQLSGDPVYSKAAVSNNCAKSTTPGCGEGAPLEGTFSGGPDGVITIESYEYKLKEGKYFEFITGGKTFKYTIENPEIFSKYNWDGSANAEERKLEDSGVTIENVSRNVEVNLPNPDGTYDEKNWKLAVDLDDDAGSLPVGTHIRTWAFGRAVLSFDDGTIFKMAAKSEIVLLSPAAKQSKIKLLPGAY
ncbi:MAG: hypothetical protein UV73_C0003G0004 [Candidatus Gottesmanbacteria bacterium GW2011_GWA2_43_14]|uniref:Uncharacterized protein n=1 Tax=Candidatus Gottesmanbacteria bacterium GW2011_GWA2_43_14 TaxID=1618443 RepID=A0A0G1DKF4_9BACT|nr:MAG: hypothetical protein UV73_C0003G0004 [Candidatus Gottesmanbacteria bacterium GW2011_GWA2_43_14]